MIFMSVYLKVIRVTNLAMCQTKGLLFVRFCEVFLKVIGILLPAYLFFIVSSGQGALNLIFFPLGFVSGMILTIVARWLRLS